MMPVVDARTGIYILIGNPVDHSLSPAIHNSAFQALSINNVYLTAAVEADRVDAALDGVRALGIKGLNVTSPHKEAVIAHLDVLSPEAKAVSSVNTIVNRSGSLEGYTTDGGGFAKQLEEIRPSTDLKRILLIGAGGAARSIAYAVAVKHPGIDLCVLNRGAERGEELVSLLKKSAGQGRYEYRSLDGPDLPVLISESKLIIYSLPHDAPQILEALSRTNSLDPGSCLVDLRYSPPHSRTMRLFSDRGGRVFNGLGMLYWQAVLSFEIFTAQKAPLDIMRAAAGLEKGSAVSGDRQ